MQTSPQFCIDYSKECMPLRWPPLTVARVTKIMSARMSKVKAPAVC
uniref:Uncharacterized protein n=1 Tax=Anguilla anguilla TaxID=7936 RepID=A0A0E9PFK5_ANGAN